MISRAWSVQASVSVIARGWSAGAHSVTVNTSRVRCGAGGHTDRSACVAGPAIMPPPHSSRRESGVTSALAWGGDDRALNLSVQIGMARRAPAAGAGGSGGEAGQAEQISAQVDSIHPGNSPGLGNEGHGHQYPWVAYRCRLNCESPNDAPSPGTSKNGYFSKRKGVYSCS